MRELKRDLHLAIDNPRRVSATKIASTNTVPVPAVESFRLLELATTFEASSDLCALSSLPPRTPYLRGPRLSLMVYYRL